MSLTRRNFEYYHESSFVIIVEVHTKETRVSRKPLITEHVHRSRPNFQGKLRSVRLVLIAWHVCWSNERKEKGGLSTGAMVSGRHTLANAGTIRSVYSTKNGFIVIEWNWTGCLCSQFALPSYLTRVQAQRTCIHTYVQCGQTGKKERGTVFLRSCITYQPWYPEFGNGSRKWVARMNCLSWPKMGSLFLHWKQLRTLVDFVRWMF